MAQATQTRLPADQRRATIETAAARLFAERGYAGTKLDDIAAAAGVTKPIVYRHFDDKKALHIALLGQHRDGLLTALAASAGGDGPLEQRLPAILEAWFGYVEAHPYAWRMLFRDTTGDPEIQAFHRELQASARALTARLIAEDSELSVPAGDLEPRAELIRSATTGLALWWLEHTEIERVEVVRIAGDFLLRGLTSVEAHRKGT